VIGQALAHACAESTASSARVCALQASGAISRMRQLDQTRAMQCFVLTRLSERRGCDVL
jgi:hypothetical protein